MAEQTDSPPSRKDTEMLGSVGNKGTDNTKLNLPTTPNVITALLCVIKLEALLEGGQEQ